MGQTVATSSSTCSDPLEVKILFKAMKCGFGAYEIIADPDRVSRLSGRKRRSARCRRDRMDLKQQSLSRRDTFITELDFLPPLLVGVVTKAEYLKKMDELKHIMSTSSGHTIPFLIFFAFLVTGLVVDAIWEWLGFFMIVLPVFAFFISFDILKKQFKADVEGLFRDWPNVRATFKSNVAGGSIALLQLRVVV